MMMARDKRTEVADQIVAIVMALKKQPCREFRRRGSKGAAAERSMVMARNMLLDAAQQMEDEI